MHISLHNFRPPAPLRNRLRGRRGISALALVLSFGVIASLIALAVDLGLLVQRHQQLKTAGEAASLASANQLFNSLPITIHDTPPLTSARQVAMVYAAENSFNEFRLQLESNLSNRPNGDIVVGSLDPLELGGSFMTVDSEDKQFDDVSLNAILVRTRHSQAGGFGPLLLFGSMVGVPSQDVYTESIAAVDRRITGYRPAGCAPVPMLPLLCATKRWELNDLQIESVGEEEQGKQEEDRSLDKFSYDPLTCQVSEGKDSIPEIEFVLCTGESQGKLKQDKEGAEPSHKFKLGQPIPAEIVQFVDSQDDQTPLLNQVMFGLTARNLVALGGQVMVGTQLPVLGGKNGEMNEKEQGNADINWEDFNSALQAIVGQPRLLLLGSGHSDRGGQPAVVEEFAAGVVVYSLSGGGVVTIRIQPVVLNSCTAIADRDTKANPWVGKVLLVR